jgi:hypothetical protein
LTRTNRKSAAKPIRAGFVRAPVGYSRSGLQPIGRIRQIFNAAAIDGLSKKKDRLAAALRIFRLLANQAETAVLRLRR